MSTPLSDYKFELARSADLTRLGDLTQARERSLQLALNRAGAFTCSLPMSDTMAEQVKEIETCIIISRNAEVIWSGPVWNIAEQITADSAKMTVGSVGWLQTLDKRVIRPSWSDGVSVPYGPTDAGLIAQNLLARSNADADAAGAPSYVFPGTVEATQIRTRTYQPWAPVLTSINELTEIESGFDMQVDPVDRTLNIFSRVGEDRGVLFQLPGDVRSVSRQTDSGSITNFLTAYSTFGTASEADPDSLAELGLFEEAPSISDVINIDILRAYAAGEIFFKSRPLPIITFQPLPESPERPNAPHVFQDFNLGDLVRLTARRGRLQLDRQILRIFSFSVSFPDTGGAEVSDLQTTVG